MKVTDSVIRAFLGAQDGQLSQLEQMNRDVRARERPNEPTIFCIFPARRISKNSGATNKIVGPKSMRQNLGEGAKAHNLRMPDVGH